MKDSLQRGILEAESSAIAFSGGLDSTLLLAISGYRLKPYTVGFPDSHDIMRSRHVADELGFSVKEIILDHLILTESVRELKTIDPKITQAEIGYELVLYHTLSGSQEPRLVTGQGADEIFYGYRKFLDSPGLTNAGHMEKLYHVTLPRELKIAEHFAKSIITPYLEPALVQAFSGLSRDLNIENGLNKIMLRELARQIGLPRDIWSFRKKAAQYGSGIQAQLRKISGLR